MEWLLEHIDVVLPVALVLLFLFQKMFVPDEGESPVPGDSEADEEARRIQEEIRRKIIARQQGRDPSTHEEPPEEEEAYRPPVYQDPAARQRSSTFPRREERGSSYDSERSTPPPVPPFERPADPIPPRRDLQDELRIQQERLRKAREAKEAAVKRTSERGLRRPKSVGEVGRRIVTGDLRGQVVADLATSQSMKRAFVLKEVVDRPIGLRDRPDVFSNWS